MMRIEKQMVIAFAAIAVLGGLSIFTLPLRHPVPETPESGLSTEPCTLDLEVERIEDGIEERKAYLDSLLETAELVERFSEATTEATTEDTTEATTEAEETTIEESTTEEETGVPEPSTQAFQPVNSMMDQELQKWVYEYGTSQAIDPYIIMAICERESGCIERILGDNGRAFGIMQVQTRWVQDRITAHGWTNEDMLRAEPNIVIGVEILKDHLLTGKGMEWALTAYRYGPAQANLSAQSDYSAEILRRAEELRR